MTTRRSPSQFLANFGTATLVAGAATGIAPGYLTHMDACTILLTRNTPGGALGFLAAVGRNPGDIDFDIVSDSATDTSSINWVAIPKNPGIKSALTASTNWPADGSLRRPPSGIFIARGLASLIAGTRTVTVGKSFGPNAKVFAMAETVSGTPGFISIPDATVDEVAGTFVLNSSSALDTSTVDWVLFDQPLRFSPSGPRMGQAKGTLVDGSAVFDGLNPMNDPEVSVIASVYLPGGTDGQLSAPSNGRYPIVTDGSIRISGGDIANVAGIELAVF